MNRNPKSKTYLTDTGEVRLTKLTDDAVAVLEDIHYNGVGRQRDRSRGRYLGKVRRILLEAGYTQVQATRHVHDQILPIFELNINAAA